MCGIIGIIGGGTKAESQLRAHIESLSHRGPDSYHVLSEEGFAFGHTLLSIIGSTPFRQPIVSKNGRIALTYNGEIYNYREILSENPVLRAQCSGNSDTEVLVEGLAIYGMEFVEQLNGMFAFVAYDRQTQTSYLVRDRLGIKPLYYIQKGEAIYFASEAKPLVKLAEHTIEPDAEGYYSYARFRYPIGARTFFKGVRMLEPGSIMSVHRGQAQIRKYWDIQEPEPFTGTYEEAKGEIVRLLEDAVRIQMRSDHSFCTYLSGGLDSSYLTALAKRASSRLDTYSIGIEVEKFDETRYSTEVANALGTRHHAYLLERDEYREHHKALVEHLGTPVGVPNQVALKVLSRELAKDHRCVLSGEGADEVFGGYGRIFLLPWDWEVLKDAQDGKGPAAQKVLKKIAAAYGDDEFQDYPAFFLRRYGYLTHSEAGDVLGRVFSSSELNEAQESVESEIRDIFSKWSSNLYTRQLLLFQKLHLPGLLLRLDTATMAHSVEGRVPFLDHRLVEFLNSLPIEFKMKRKASFAQAQHEGLLSDELSEVHDVPKAPLKEIAEKVLPASIVWRRKMGFPIPTSYYEQEKAAPKGASSYLTWVQRNVELLELEGVKL